MSRKVPILLYHRIGERDGSFMDKYTVSPETFGLQLEWIEKHDWRPMRLENISAEQIDKAPERSFVITFDDAFASNRIHAWPILEKYKFPSTTFVVTSLLGSRNAWDGPGRDGYALLSRGELAAANSQFMSFHSHSATHPNLRKLGRDALRAEIGESKRSASFLDVSDLFFAYPFGALDREVMEEVRKAGFAGGCTCFGGLNSCRTNPFLLRRVEIKESDLGWRLWLKMNTGRDIFANPFWLFELRDWLRAKVKRRSHPH